MKPIHQETIKNNLPKALPKINKLLADEGLEEFCIKEISLQAKEDYANYCQLGQEPCLVPNGDGTGYHVGCVPINTCPNPVPGLN